VSDLSDELYMKDPRSKSVEGFIAGLTILANHMPKGICESFAFGAEHDIIHIWGEVTLEKLPPDSEDGRALLALGFHAEEDLDQWGYFT
jgi:hypothetical protein